MLTMAADGLRLLLGGGPLYTRVIGFRNVVTWGRAVTNILQQLRSIEPGFEEWYQPYVDEMRDDPLMRRFYEMRSEILKQGELGVITFMALEFWGPGVERYFGPPPPNAVDLVASEAIGGAAWVVELPDGSREHFFVPLPPEVGVATAHLEETPNSHLGRAITDGSIESLGRLYFDYLRILIEDAKRMFRAPR